MAYSPTIRYADKPHHYNAFFIIIFAIETQQSLYDKFAGLGPACFRIAAICRRKDTLIVVSYIISFLRCVLLRWTRRALLVKPTRATTTCLRSTVSLHLLRIPTSRSHRTIIRPRLAGGPRRNTSSLSRVSARPISCRNPKAWTAMENDPGRDPHPHLLPDPHSCPEVLPSAQGNRRLQG